MPKSKELKQRRNASSPPGKAPEYDYPSDVYESSNSGGGYPRHKIDWDGFYSELRDLLGRYGGVDYQDFRLRAIVTDILTHYHHQFLEVPKITPTTTAKEDWDAVELAKANIDIANRQLQWALMDLKHKRLSG
jgi:hypothetical protein